MIVAIQAASLSSDNSYLRAADKQMDEQPKC